MKSKLIFIILLFCGIINAQSFQFVKKGGGPSSDYGYGMCVDNAGNMYVTGCYKSTATFDNVNTTSNGLFDIFIAKYNSTGTLQWFKTAGGSGSDEALRIFVTDDGSVFVGGTIIGLTQFDGITVTVNGGAFAGEDLFLAKLNSSGTYQWIKTYGSADQDWIDDLSISGNNIFLTGHYTGTFTAPGGITLSPSGSSIAKFFMKIDSDGNPVWAKNIGGTAWISASSDKLYIAGLFTGTANFGSLTFVSSGPSDLYLGAYDFNGNQLWMKQFGGNGSENMRSICFDRASNNIYWAGCFQNSMTLGSNVLTSAGQYDIFVSKFDADGNNIWAKRAGGANFDFANAACVDAQGNMFVSGYCMETATFGNSNVISAGQGDAYIAKYNSNGDFQWVRSGGGSDQDNGMYLAAGSSGSIYLTGFFGSAATFGNLSISSNGAGDMFLLKIADVTSIISPRETVNSYRLNQNYPNPFNPSTKISFDINKPGFVKLTVMDVAGKEIAELVNASMNTGSYEVNFNAENLSGGVYFYKLETANGSDTKKMILVK